MKIVGTAVLILLLTTIAIITTQTMHSDFTSPVVILQALLLLYLRLRHLDDAIT